MRASEQRALRRVLARRQLLQEPAAIQFRPIAVLRIEAQSLACQLEAVVQQVRVHALAAHAGAESAVVVLAAAQLLDGAHHVRSAIRVMGIEPVAEQRCNFQLQAERKEEISSIKI